MHNICSACKSRLTGSELQGQEEAACKCPAYTTTGVLFTGNNTVKIASAVTWSFKSYRLVIMELISSYYIE